MVSVTADSGACEPEFCCTGVAGVHPDKPRAVARVNTNILNGFTFLFFLSPVNVTSSFLELALAK